MPYANNKEVDQLALLHSLSSSFVIRTKTVYSIYSNKRPLSNELFYRGKDRQMPSKLALGYQSILFFALIFIQNMLF